jgi:Arc-like DNA binding domain
MARTKRPQRWFDKSPAQIKVRLPEALRWSLEKEASSRGHSMNAEIVRRLRDSFLTRDNPTRLVAEALVEKLDDGTLEEMVDIVMRSRAEDELGYAGLDAMDEAKIERELERRREGSE